MDRLQPNDADKDGRSNVTNATANSAELSTLPSTDVSGSNGETKHGLESTSDPQPLTYEDVAKTKMFSRVFRYIYLARLEFFLFLYVFSRSMAGTPIGDLLLQKACLNNLQCNASVCQGMDHYPDIKDAAEKIASNYSMFRIIIAFGPSVVIAVFLGPWCDKYGYKPPLHISNIGYIIGTVFVLVTAYMMPLPLYYDVLAAIPDGLSGGIISVFMAVYSEATVQTKGSQRRTKFFLLNLCFAAGFPLGGIIGGQIYGRFGIRVVLWTSICLSAMGQLWVMFVLAVPERVKLLNDSAWTKLRCLFKVQNFVDGFRACARDRPGRGKAQLWLIFATQTIMVLDMTASTVSYYYVRKMYSWSVAHYTTVSAVSSGVSYVFYIPIMFLFTRVLKMSDLWMAIIGVSFAVAQMVLCGLAYTEWLYYVQCAVGIPTFLGSVGLRTHMSKLLEDHEVGKVFAFFASCESILPLAGEVVFTKIFQWSLDFLPGMVYLVAAALSVCSILLIGYGIHLSSQTYSPTEEETESIREDSPSINN